jgi:hypothetical protein
MDGNNTPTLQELATFTHSMCTRANTVKFAHQLLFNPKILSLVKAMRRGFLKGCPNLNPELIMKYLNPSSATAKGHMKRPKQGIRSTRRKAKTKGDSVSTTPTRIQQVQPVVFAVPSRHYVDREGSHVHD